MNILQVIACILFLVFFLFFYIVRKNYLISVILLVAFSNYAAINCEIGKIKRDGIQDYLPRYLDWIITTPLLLFILMKKLKIKNIQKIVMIMFFDVVMIYTGFFAIMANSINSKLIMYSISCFLFFIIFLSIFNKSSILFWYLFIIWALYPIVWFLHENKNINNDNYDSCISVLDVISKIGFSFLI